MYAVVQTGGKQYLVREGQEFLVEKLPLEANSAVTLDDVLFVGQDGKAKVGQPKVAGAKVVCTLVTQELGPKLWNFKMRRRKNSRRLKGHRQEMTRLLVKKIEATL